MRTQGLRLMWMWAVSLAAAAAGPQIEIEPDCVEIGPLVAGQAARVAVILKNTGDQPLAVQRIQSSCGGCTTYVLAETTVQPGNSVTLQLFYHAKRGPGDYASVLTVHTNDAAKPTKQIRLKVKVVSADGAPRIVIEPAELDTGAILLSARRTVRALISNPKPAKTPLKLTRVLASEGCRVLSPHARKVQPGTYAVISIEVRAGRPGPLKEHVSLETNDPVRPVVTVPIRGTVVEKGEPPASVASSGVLIEPIGEAIVVPGTGGAFCQKLFVQNGTGKVVRVSFPSDGKAVARAKGRALVLEPGESAVVELQLEAGQVGKTETIPIRIEFPVIKR